MDRHGYSRIDKEDPEDVKHRKAQFLIYKSMERADTMQKKRPLSGLRVRVSKLKIKIGRKLKMMKKSVLLTMSSAKGGVYKQFTAQLRVWKRLVHGGHAMVTLPPVFKC